MQFQCTLHLGQGLRAINGFHWDNALGLGIALSSSSAAGGTNANGRQRFPFSWYTRLAPIALTPKEQAWFKAFLKHALQTLPSLRNDDAIDNAAIFEMKAVTSNAEEQRILLIVSDKNAGLPKWLAGFECIGACFLEDRQPLIFGGAPGDEPGPITWMMK